MHIKGSYKYLSKGIIDAIVREDVGPGGHGVGSYELQELEGARLLCLGRETGGELALCPGPGGRAVVF